MSALSDKQFAALAELIGSRGGPAEIAARRILVDGASPAEAVSETGISRSAVGNVIARYRRALALAQAATKSTLP